MERGSPHYQTPAAYCFRGLIRLGRGDSKGALADAGRALEALGQAGFATQRTDDFWLFKGIKEGVLVDVIFRSTGDLYLDEEMLARASVEDFKGLRFRVVAPEDLVVIKAVVHDEKTPRHWFDALGIIARAEIDWPYLVWRARLARRRVASLLLYALSNDLPVPPSAVTRAVTIWSQGRFLRTCSTIQASKSCQRR